MKKEELLRQLPAVHELVSSCQLTDCPPQLLTAAARDVLSYWRTGILEEGQVPPNFATLAAQVDTVAREMVRPNLRPVINATGVVLHTNMGRAPLSEAACQAVLDVARGYSNLEMDLESGERGERYSHVEKLLCRLTGAEAALVVNNNAGAVLLALHALAQGKEVVVARGELVEIGGSFRIPEIMAQSGALLREVGTTNRTHPRDYEQAVSPDTALILKVHPSNFRVMGFTREVKRQELAAIGLKHQIPVMEDLGSGVLVDLQEYGIDPEPTVQETLAAGVDLVTISGDKLLGGPQSGIILGREDLVKQLKTDQLLRALRVDKMTLAALEATLRAYLQEDAYEKIPVLRMLTQTEAELEKRAVALKDLLAKALEDKCVVIVKSGVSRAGGGSLPLTDLSTTLVVLYPQQISPAELAERLRLDETPVVVRLQDEGVLIDPRTLLPGDEEILSKALQRAMDH
ncbi:MAG: L-seryl-tRNA(Sec) selenium transferase [Syntrophaceticus sp.]|nr:L-seryl-tRNA(Sec) selenium transferase [Syntrophaceticus sp.]MDD4359264.1 L-seryl-tRNA(Sec) selenium transferase [Syntrophaceticus sp.]MDD4782112.1 L-seryl-tRNA(Sec) selenium transferase [Syntrophaceticus sp.]HBG22851.1 L-seryl-tRNA(Sec) selenium transferase [Peptococcaceae bacterium]